MSKNQQSDGPKPRPLLERRTPVGISVAMLILFGFFFLMPSAFRAARLSLNEKENDIKDWLPSEFVETAELEWFAEHFAGESFIIATWPGCNEDDQRLTLLESKLRNECSSADPAANVKDAELAEDFRSAKDYGVRLGLLPASRSLDNWGGQNEKWFATPEGRWYYILPNGHLHRWEGKSNGPAGLVRSVKRTFGTQELEGTFVAAFGPEDPEQINPFYNDTSRLCAPMFENVETGVSMVKELAKEGGLLWPVDFTDQSMRATVAKRRAMERLTGSLFAPAVPAGFSWTAEAFRRVLPPKTLAELPAEFDQLVEQTLTRFADERLEGDRESLARAYSPVQAEAWYEVFDACGVEPPPRQTALLITLTDIAKDNLAYALGRGVMGGPRGRLLELANDSGVQPAAPPSMAPPPFDRKEVESIAGVPPLRLGGPPVDNIAIDEEGSITLVRLVGYSVLVGAFLSYLCFASVKITLMVFVVGGSAALMSMACVSWTGGRVDAVLMSMPSLVYVLGLSGAIHVINYYRDEVRSGGRSGAAGRALRHAAFPCSLAALTTAIGLGSLYTSNLAPISNFGFYASIGVIATLAILFSYLPAALQVFVSESQSRFLSGSDSSDSNEESAVEESWLSDRWAAVGAWICRHYVVVTAACMAALLGATVGLRKIETSVQLLKLFDSEARIIRDYAWLESNFGRLVPMELVLRVPEEIQSEPIEMAGSAAGGPQPDESTVADTGSSIELNILERVEAVARISHVIHETLGEPGIDVVGSVTGINTFLKPLPSVTNGWNPVRAQYVKELRSNRAELLTNDYVRLESSGPFEGSELWRISLRVGALTDVDYGMFIDTLRTAVEPVLRAYETRHQILTELDDLRKSGTVDKSPTIVLIGRSRPDSLSESKLISDPGVAGDDSIRIDVDTIFAATLDELLRGERVRQAVWIDPSSKEKPIKIGSDLWDRVIDRADVVVWVGSAAPPTGAFDEAKAWVDGTSILQKPIAHELTEDRTPIVSGGGAMQMVYTGAVPVVYKAQRTLLGSLVESIGLAFVLIAIVMILLLNPARAPVAMLGVRNFGSGLMAGSVSMIPNMFPVLLVFGMMGHMGRLIDIGTMMTASVAMGVAVDDTIHFLTWFRSYLDKGFDRIKAVEMTYRRVGPAMTQTTIVGGVGLFVFALSTFTPTQRFGTLMLILLAAALVGDLILLPALLASPLGKVFRPRVGSRGASDNLQEGLTVIEPDDPEDEPVEKNALPHLKLHSPDRRADKPHRMKGR
ncbi:MAG: MMPL family transporter [Planctomycetota bacterium]